MKPFCQNPLCESPGAKVVSVSVRKHADQQRTLCAACEEVYTWGVQHGRMISYQAEIRKTRILITVSGGVVTSVMCSDAQAEARILDWDNLKTGQDVKDEDEIVEPEVLAKKYTVWAASNRLIEVY